MTNKNRGQWTEKDDARLLEEWTKGTTTKNIAVLLGRTQASVYTRLSKMRKSGVDVERRGESTGPVTPSRKGGPKNVLPTGEDVDTKTKKRAAKIAAVRKARAESKVELNQFMVDKINEEFVEMQVITKALRDRNAQLQEEFDEMLNVTLPSLRSDNASLRQRLSQVKQKSSDAATEFMRQLERENAALRAALVASNNVIAVYTARGEDSNE